MSILDELWSMDIAPAKKGYYTSREFISATEKVAEAEASFTELLSEEVKEAFDEYQLCQQDYMLLTDQVTFKKGFRLGAQIMLEILQE